MTKTDEHLDFQQWSQEWQAGGARDAATDEQIRHYVKRRTGLVWWFLLGDFVIAVVMLPILAYYGIWTNNSVQSLAMAALASITIGAVGFGWWNWRGVLRASAGSVSEYIAISAERLRRMRLAWRIAWFVLAAQVVVFTFWIRSMLYFGPDRPSPGSELFAWVWLIGFSGAAVIGLMWFDRWLKRDEARFERLKRELE
ncbi:MAG TPA: hypothetical protein VNT81_10070 [Vicinamibacterales bacterium]|nr:hypothetical protein [Vicinamibacterales bacterium]